MPLTRREQAGPGLACGGWAAEEDRGELVEHLTCHVPVQDLLAHDEFEEVDLDA